MKDELPSQRLKRYANNFIGRGDKFILGSEEYLRLEEDDRALSAVLSEQDEKISGFEQDISTLEDAIASGENTKKTLEGQTSDKKDRLESLHTLSEKLDDDLATLAEQDKGAVDEQEEYLKNCELFRRESEAKEQHLEKAKAYDEDNKEKVKKLEDEAEKLVGLVETYEGVLSAAAEAPELDYGMKTKASPVVGDEVEGEPSEEPPSEKPEWLYARPDAPPEQEPEKKPGRLWRATKTLGAAAIILSGLFTGSFLAASIMNKQQAGLPSVFGSITGLRSYLPFGQSGLSEGAASAGTVPVAAVPAEADLIKKAGFVTSPSGEQFVLADTLEAVPAEQLDTFSMSYEIVNASTNETVVTEEELNRANDNRFYDKVEEKLLEGEYYVAVTAMDKDGNRIEVEKFDFELCDGRLILPPYHDKNLNMNATQYCSEGALDTMFSAQECPWCWEHDLLDKNSDGTLDFYGEFFPKKIVNGDKLENVKEGSEYWVRFNGAKEFFRPIKEFQSNHPEYVLSHEEKDTDGDGWSDWVEENVLLTNPEQKTIVMSTRVVPVDFEADDWFKIGYELGQRGENEASVIAYDKYIETRGDSYAAWSNKGYMLYELGRYEASIDAYEKSLAINQTNAWTWGAKGNSLLELENNVEALEAYDRALELDSGQAWVWNNKGIILKRLERYDEVLALCDKLIEIDGSKALVWYNKGYALGELGRHEEAVEAYDRALELEPDDEIAKHNRRASFARAGPVYWLKRLIS